MSVGHLSFHHFLSHYDNICMQGMFVPSFLCFFHIRQFIFVCAMFNCCDVAHNDQDMGNKTAGGSRSALQPKPSKGWQTLKRIQWVTDSIICTRLTLKRSRNKTHSRIHHHLLFFMVNSLLLFQYFFLLIPKSRRKTPISF